MTKILFGVLFSLIFLSCKKEESNSSCGSYTFSDGSTKPTYKGSQGGCYYLNSSNNKSYVDDKYCCP